MRTKKFNITGTCYPHLHYMADVSNKIAQITKMINEGDYFTINRARQYGKTTTLSLLEDRLPELGYLVVKISFEGIGDTPFESEAKFCQSILDQISYYLELHKKEEYKDWVNDSVKTNQELDKFLDKVCKGKKYVLMIDETDKASNNLVFLRFLGMLRDKYLTRGKAGFTFHNVILAGVYDIKNLKLKMIQAGTHQLQDGEKRINSPWNIATEFKVDMSLSVPEIISMLEDYENDEHTGMDIPGIAGEIRYYTSGYPFLVSKLCKMTDEEFDKNWTIDGLQEAIKELLMEQNTLFDDLFKNVRSNESLRNLLYSLVFEDTYYSYNPYNEAIELGLIFGILTKSGTGVVVSNKIFELLLSNYFISEQEIKRYADLSIDLRHELTAGGKLNMPLLIQRFQQHYYELFSERDVNFLENECRLLFLTYLRPIINGKGFYHIESETRDNRRMDIIVDYGEEQFVVELKLWRGQQQHTKAYNQLSGYLNSRHLKEGYLLTFDFTKKGKFASQWIEYEDKKIFDCDIWSGRK